MYQQLILVGHLGQTPEMRYTPSGVPVTSFSLAVNRVWSTADGQRQEKTLWFRCSAWRKTAETIAQHLQKGAKVMVIGEIEDARPYTDREGNAKASLDVTVQTIKFLDSKSEAGDRATAASGEQRPPESLDELSAIPF